MHPVLLGASLSGGLMWRKGGRAREMESLSVRCTSSFLLRWVRAAQASPPPAFSLAHPIAGGRCGFMEDIAVTLKEGTRCCSQFP